MPCRGQELCTPPPSSAFSLWQLFSQALEPDRRPSALSGLWSQAFRLGLSSSQMQMKDHQGCPRQG